MPTISKILLIDDNDELRSALAIHLSSQDYNVRTAANGFEGIKLFKAAQPAFDLVITDLVMPNISGVGVITMVKEKSPGTPVIAITGWGEHPETLAAEAKADLILEKPFNLKEIDAHIRKLLKTRKK